MKGYWMKKISIVLAALLLLAALPVSAMAEKETKPETEGTEMTATFSNASKETATSSDAYEDGELLDGQVADDLPPAEEEKTAPEKDLIPAETAAAAEAAAKTELPETDGKITEADLAGIWTVDGFTNYQFDEDGTGALILPEHEYAFSYTIDGDELSLEFESGEIGKTVFTFGLEEDTLTLERETEAGTAVFTLEKK